MNKKFSTLVAALLVSGGSLVVASQYMGSPLMSSPLAMAATANLRATVTGYEVASATYNSSEATKWTLDGNKLHNGEGYYLAANANGALKMVKGSTNAATVTYNANSHIAIGDKILAFDGGNLTLVNEANAGRPATFFKTNGAQLPYLDGSASYIGFIGTEDLSFSMGESQVKVTNSANYTAAYSAMGVSYTNLEEKLAGASKVKVVKDKNENLFLQISTLEGTTRYLTATSDGTLSYKKDMPSGASYNASVVTVIQNVIKLGSQFLTFTSDGSGLELKASADDNLSLSFYKAGDTRVLGNVPDGGTECYLMCVRKTHRANIALANTSGAIWLAKMTASTAASATVGASATKLTLAPASDGKVNIKSGEDFVGANGSMGGVSAAGGFKINSDGSVEGLYLSSTGLTSAPTDAEQVYAFGANGKPLTGTPDENTAVKLATLKTTVNSLTAASKVMNTKANTVADVPALGQPKALVEGANYYLLENGRNYALTPEKNIDGTYNLSSVAKNNITADDDLSGLWKVTAVKWNTNGVATHYSFTYRTTPTVKLAFSITYNKTTHDWNLPTFDPSGKYSEFFVGENGYITFAVNETYNDKGDIKTNTKTYSLDWDNNAWEVVEFDEDAEQFKVELSDVVVVEDNVPQQVEWLNETAGNGSGFGLAYVDDNKKVTLEENVLTEGVTAVQGPDFTYLKDVVNAGNYSGKMFLKISGDYEYKAPTGTTAQKEALATAQLADFRASTFVAIDTVLYSKLIDDENPYYYLVSVKGSDMVSTKGKDASMATSYDDLTATGSTAQFVGLKRRIENAQFIAHHFRGSAITDPIVIEAADAVMPVDHNEKGLINAEWAGTNDGYSHYTDADGDEASLFIAVKNYNKKYYVGAAEDLSEFYVTKNNDVDFTKVNGIVNIIRRNYKVDGQVLANNDNYYNLTWVLPQYAALDKPEGQFLVTGGNYNGVGEIQPFTFTNRESGRAWKDVALKATDKENIYAVVGTNDTIEVKAAAAGDEFIGYANYSADKLANSKFVLKVVSKVGGVDDLYITEDHNKDHSLGLDADTTASATFRLIKFEGKKTTTKLYGDTVYVNTNEYSYINSKKEYAEKADRVVAFTYAIYNADNMEFLQWNYGQGSTKEQYFFSNPNLKYNEQTGANAAAAQRFIIKEKNDGTVQLIPASAYFMDEDPANFNDATSGKVYVGLSDNKLHVEGTIYKIADNDLFRVVEVGAPMYRKLDGEVYDKVRIYKEGMQNVALFAQGTDATILSGKNFLGMEHKADADLNKTMFSFMVDTAFVDRADNYKPQYLLAIDAEVVPEATYCPEHGLNPDCSHTTKKIGYAKGSYLVCLSDSAAAWSASKAHNNPYMYDGYARLGFVKAAHIGDSLMIERGKAAKADILNLKAGMTEASFALRIVDQDSKSFVMETKDGWIKWLNGVPVVVPTLAQAEVLNIEATENAATANEAIAAEGVQVIGGQGVVTVQGAAGKVITVANILGQTIANQVAASDNVTIAAPAGVVVVAVEGDATKVVVK